MFRFDVSSDSSGFESLDSQIAFSSEKVITLTNDNLQLETYLFAHK